MREPRSLAGFVLLSVLVAAPIRGDVGLDLPFDDGTATDVSGNGNHGQLLGAPEVVAGISGRALLLDGEEDGVRVDDVPSLAIAVPRVEVWFYLQERPTTGAELISKRAADGGYRVVLTPAGLIRFEVGGPGESVAITAPFVIQPDVWTPVVVKYDGQQLDLYIYGELAATAAAAADVVTQAPIMVGQGFVGLVDEVRVGDDELTPEDACEASLKVYDPAGQWCLDAMLDVTAELGVGDATNRAFGATLVDVNADGWLDLYYANGAGDPANVESSQSGVCPELPPVIEWVPGGTNVLHLNNGDGTFAPDSAPAAGIDDQWFAMRHAWGDFDNDGDRDLVSHNFLVSPLYVAVQGPADLLFEDQRELTGLNPCLLKGTGFSWADLNADGYLDAYAVEYDPQRLAVEHVNLLYLSDTQGGFVDVTAQSGLTLPDNPMGQVFGDYDNDGDLDVFVTNSHEAPSRLYRHMGLDVSGIPQFVDVASQAGVAVIGEPDLGIGSDFGDVNNDGRLDLLFVRERDSRVFVNDGPNGEGDWTFTDITDLSGLDMAGNQYWGGAFADLDNDGWEDLVLANKDQGNSVFMNNGGGSWTEVAATLGMDLSSIPALGVVPGDIDNDGDLDVVLVSGKPGDPSFLFRNEARGNNWIQFRLTGTESNRDAVGARIVVRARLEPGESQVQQIREVVAGVGFFSDHPRIQTFGLGKGDRVSATVRWPSGIVQRLGALAINQRHDIVEPAAGPETAD